MTQSPGEPLAKSHLRIARPTDRLAEVVSFYKNALGFDELGRFANHKSFDGVMLGHSGLGYHLEFTHAHGHEVGNSPTDENLLVFYLPNIAEWESLIGQIEKQGHVPVTPFNSYWERQGKTYADPDGYRVVIQNAAWPGHAG